MDQVRELVTRAAAGGSLEERVGAYGRLVERFRDMACGYAYAILGDFHLAEDAAQEAFVTAYRKLGQLDEPGAFPGWFRSIVRTTCGQMTRGKTLPMAPMDAAGVMPSREDSPGELAEAQEMRDQVLAAISQLPDEQREVTTLFYINGYSQQDIADFLEVPVGTVKNRLHASRGRLRQRMLNMVKDTLHASAPDERFDKRVIESLLARPNLLDIPGHPVRQVLDAIRQALAEFDFVAAEDVVVPPVKAAKESFAQAYQVDDGKILSYETTISLFQAAEGRRPPVHLIVAGRSFRAVGETLWHSKTFHQMDALVVERGASYEQCLALLRRVLGAALGDEHFVPGEVVPLWYAKGYRQAMVKSPDGLINPVGYGRIESDVLADLGYDPQNVGGYAVDVGLDRLAMLRCGVRDIRALWEPPYLR
ncbi:MAG: sigma-70 family RNA polymerase sigma factor [Phycisphaeraceae bacterium]|nr:sigma-70 family RNA polymerase sigma factor [Phycisphaeraceae bacterium]